MPKLVVRARPEIALRMCELWLDGCVPETPDNAHRMRTLACPPQKDRLMAVFGQHSTKCKDQRAGKCTCSTDKKIDLRDFPKAKGFEAVFQTCMCRSESKNRIVLIRLKLAGKRVKSGCWQLIFYYDPTLCNGDWETQLTTTTYYKEVCVPRLMELLPSPSPSPSASSSSSSSSDESESGSVSATESTIDSPPHLPSVAAHHSSYQRYPDAQPTEHWPVYHMPVPSPYPYPPTFFSSPPFGAPFAYAAHQWAGCGMPAVDPGTTMHYGAAGYGGYSGYWTGGSPYGIKKEEEVTVTTGSVLGDDPFCIWNDDCIFSEDFESCIRDLEVEV